MKLVIGKEKTFTGNPVQPGGMLKQSTLMTERLVSCTKRRYVTPLREKGE